MVPKLDYPETEIVGLCKELGLIDKIESLEDKWDFKIGENG